LYDIPKTIADKMKQELVYCKEESLLLSQKKLGYTRFGHSGLISSPRGV